MTFVINTIRLFGWVWCFACMVQMALIFLAGWSNGDTLLLTFNANNEKWIEIVLVPVGTVCALVLCMEELHHVCQRWYAGIGKTSGCEQ